MLVSMEAVRVRRIFDSSFLLCLFFFPFPLVHDCITQYHLRKRKRGRENERDKENEGKREMHIQYLEFLNK